LSNVITDSRDKHEIITIGRLNRFFDSLLYVYTNVPKDSIYSIIAEAEMDKREFKKKNLSQKHLVQNSKTIKVREVCKELGGSPKTCVCFSYLTTECRM